MRNMGKKCNPFNVLLPIDKKEKHYLIIIAWATCNMFLDMIDRILLQVITGVIGNQDQIINSIY